MSFTQKAALLAVWCLGVVLSATGVPESDFYPLIEYWKAGDYRANPLCEGDEKAPPVPGSRATDYPFRTSIGLKDLTASFLQLYKDSIGSLSTSDISYAANQRRKGAAYPTLVTAALKGLIESKRKGVPSGFAPQLCSLFETQSVPVEAFCYAMGNFSQTTQCLTNYEYEYPDRVLKTLSPNNDFGYNPIPGNCLKGLSTGQNPLDFGLQIFGYTPDVIDEATAYSESRMYYLAYKAIDHVNRYAEYKYLTALDELKNSAMSEEAQRLDKKNMADKTSAGIHNIFQDSEVFEEILPGYVTQRVFYANEPRFKGGPTLRTPFAVVATRGTDMLVVLRSTTTTYDARLALYNQQAFKYLYNFTGEIHDGSATVYQTLSGILEFAVDQFYYDMRPEISKQSRPPKITVLGAGLPATGAAVALAVHLQKSISASLGGPKTVTVNSITFGAPYVGDEAFLQMARKIVEMRHISIEGDSTDLFPCKKTWSCDERVLLARTGIETGILYEYEQTPGYVSISFERLARQHRAWGEESAILQIAAIKDCAYMCVLASEQCAEDEGKNLCDPNHCESFLVV